MYISRPRLALPASLLLLVLCVSGRRGRGRHVAILLGDGIVFADGLAITGPVFWMTYLPLAACWGWMRVERCCAAVSSSWSASACKAFSSSWTLPWRLVDSGLRSKWSTACTTSLLGPNLVLSKLLSLV